MSEPEEAVLAVISSASISGLTVATKTEPIFDGNLVRGPVRPTAEGMSAGKAVFVQETGGISAYPFLGTAVLDHKDVVQVVVRGDPKDYAGGLALARLVFAACHNATVSGYYACLCRGSAPQFLAMDEEHRSLFSFQVDLRRAV